MEYKAYGFYTEVKGLELDDQGDIIDCYTIEDPDVDIFNTAQEAHRAHGIAINAIRNNGQQTATNFDIRIHKELAEMLLEYKLLNGSGISIMCKEYGDDDDWCGLEPEDLDEDGKLSDDLQTFELWIPDRS